MLGEAMNIYLDTSALNRIFVDQSQPRIFLEASAMLLVFGLIEKRIISIVSSEVLISAKFTKPLCRTADFRYFGLAERPCDPDFK